VRQSEHFAARLAGISINLDEQIKHAFRLAFSREITADELQLLVDYSHRHGMANTCRLLLNSNEFLFVN
jgi:hypothetical protein